MWKKTEAREKEKYLEIVRRDGVESRLREREREFRKEKRRYEKEM
jgi:hypothetical protein